MRLVVCVDRDDDLGYKAGVPGPVVGREKVIEAATKLGMADPEDTDTNAMFAAVRLLDEIQKTGEDCEVVVLTGSPKVGPVSDRKVGEQFDQVLAAHPATSANLISDGAEDDYVFPILYSRIKIDGVHRVHVRHNANLESTFYTLMSALEHPKLRYKTFLPLALVLLILGIAAAEGYIWWGIIGLAILLGVYLIFWTFDIDEALIESIRSASSDIRQGSVAFGFELFAIALIAVGFLAGYNAYVGHPTYTPIRLLLEFMLTGTIWWLVAAELWETGRAIRRYLIRGRMPRSYPIASTSIIGTGLLAYGVIYLVEYLESYLGPSQLPLIVGALGLGLAIIIGAGLLQQYLRARSGAALGSTSI